MNLSRRSFIRGGVAAAAGLYVLPGCSATDVDAEFERVRDLLAEIDDYQAEHVLPIVNADQILNPVNERLFNPADYGDSIICYAHIGFSEANVRSSRTTLTEDEDARRWHRADRDYYDFISALAIDPYFLDYSASVRALLTRYTGISVMFVEEASLENQWFGELPADLVPRPSDIVHATEFADSDPSEETHYFDENGELQSVRQQPEILYEHLRNSGVRNVYISGEYAYNSDRSFGCAEGAASSFINEGFNVRGISGAVYPLVPPGGGGVTQLSPGAEALYANQIDLL